MGLNGIRVLMATASRMMMVRAGAARHRSTLTPTSNAECEITKVVRTKLANPARLIQVAVAETGMVAGAVWI